MHDTPKKVFDFYLNRFTSLSGEERMKMAAGSFESVKAMVLSSLGPELSESEKRKRLLLRFYGEELDEEQIGSFCRAVDSPRKADA
jgi:hypothetical protein